MNNNFSSTTSSQLKNHNDLKNLNQEKEEFNPVIGKPYNIDKVTLQQIDNLNIVYIFTTGRSASTLLGVMLDMHDNVIFTSEEVFPIILKQKYAKIQKWTENVIKEYCDDFVIMSEGKLYPLFCGKDVLYNLLVRFQEHLNYERVIRLSYLAFGINKDLSKVTTIVDKQLRYYLAHNYLKLFPQCKVLLLVRDPRDNVYSKYNRAKRRGLEPQLCVYIHTWISAFKEYLEILSQFNKKFLIIHYENLINDSVSTMKQISDYINIPYTHQYFEYVEVVRNHFNSISHPKLKKHFFITHKSLTQPISPQKVNEWKNYPNEIGIINATWTLTKNFAEQLKYKEHENFQPVKKLCIKMYLKIKFNFISSFLYFNILPYFIKKWIKLVKYPYRKMALSTYDRFLRQSYL